MAYSQDDTIVAIATAQGKGGIGVIRLSGTKALVIGEAIARRQLLPRQAIFSDFIDPTQPDMPLLDHGIMLYFKAPHSFTGEDVVELQGHGGPVILDALVKVCLSMGAVQAKPGQFSERAFLNNKMDLTQAEAVADLINSASLEAAKNALRSLDGVFSREIHEIRQAVIDLRVFIEAAIDFPDEEIDFLSEGNVLAKTRVILEKITRTLNTARQGRIMQEGMNLVIAGKPNAGKSSLLNALAGHEAAIVTPIEGTTRDIIKEHISIDGLPIHITDTAGLRESDDLVEQEGIKRATKAIKNADAILLVVDASSLTKPHTSDDWPEALKTGAPVTVILNKIDLTGQSPDIREKERSTEILLSTKSHQGLDLLKKHLLIKAGITSQEGVFSARRRHLDALIKARTSVEDGLTQLSAFGAGELLAEDLRQCQQHLNEITGEYTADDLLGEIFGSFCIGK